MRLLPPRPWGPARAVPLAVVWPLLLGAAVGAGGGANWGGVAAVLLGSSLWVALPFLALGAFFRRASDSRFRALAVGGAVTTALAWAPLYLVAAHAVLDQPLGFWAPLGYPALWSPVVAAFGMVVGAALDPDPERYRPRPTPPTQNGPEADAPGPLQPGGAVRPPRPRAPPSVSVYRLSWTVSWSSSSDVVMTRALAW